MRVTPGFGPVAPQGEAEREAVLAGASRVTGAVVPPGLVDGHRNPQPEYPAASRLRGEQGVVGLVLGVSASGQVSSVEIGRSSGFPALDEAAKRAAQRWRFRPAMRDGTPVDGTIRTAVHFRLVQ
ncbi:MAG: energy transducer TonB [Acetobacteraceae bacterium]|nr:energy transducer TonB [Acetobacteraceae bacterium]